jgi:hypothetical protein
VSLIQHKKPTTNWLTIIIINFLKLMFPKYALYSATKQRWNKSAKVFSKEMGRSISIGHNQRSGATATDLFLWKVTGNHRQN